MGLNCSHNAFDGSYGAFYRFRSAVARAAGGSYPPHFAYSSVTGELIKDEYGFPVRDHTLDDEMLYWGDDYNKENSPGLFIFLCHEDCEGEIEPDDCLLVANDLEKLLPKLEKMKTGGGHLARYGDTMADVARNFIEGCRLAAKNNEQLLFR